MNSITCLGPAGLPILDKLGCARELLGYDLHGNCAEKRCLDDKLELALNRQGVATLRWQLDVHGQKVIEESFDDKGHRTLTNDEHFSKIFDAELQPTDGKRGYATVHHEFPTTSC